MSERKGGRVVERRTFHHTTLVRARAQHTTPHHHISLYPYTLTPLPPYPTLPSSTLPHSTFERREFLGLRDGGSVLHHEGEHAVLHFAQTEWGVTGAGDLSGV